MSQLGMGTLINMLYASGVQELKDCIEASYGKKIKTVKMEDDKLYFEMADGFHFLLRDDGQSCCESRYLSTDDDLSDFDGSTLIDISFRDVEKKDDEEGGIHDQRFMIVKTSKGEFTVCAHNEHNGYYGGFWIVAEKVEGPMPNVSPDDPLNKEPKP